MRKALFNSQPWEARQIYHRIVGYINTGKCAVPKTAFPGKWLTYSYNKHVYRAVQKYYNSPV